MLMLVKNCKITMVVAALAMLFAGVFIALCLKSNFIYVVRYAAIEAVVILTVTGCSIFVMGKESFLSGFRRNKSRLFPKIDLEIVLVQTVCMFFVMATLIFHTMFQLDTKELSCVLRSRASETWSACGDYRVDESGGEYFAFDDCKSLIEELRECEITAEAGTNSSTILLDPLCQDSYFVTRIAKHMWEPSKYGKNNEEMVPKEAANYMPYPANDVKFEIIPGGETTDEKACVLVLPGYDTSNPEAIMQEGKMVSIGRVEKSKKDPRDFRSK